MDFLLDKKIKSWIHECKLIIDGSRGDVEVEFKSSYRDPVTNIDKKVEKHLINRIKESFPDHDILAEETSGDSNNLADGLDFSHLWIVDPIDGTSNFIKQRKNYCTMISYFEDKQPIFSYIYNYTDNELVCAFKDIGVYLNEIKMDKPANQTMSESMISLDSRVLHNKEFFTSIANTAYCLRAVGAAGLDGVKVAKGEFGGYINLTASPWDYAAFILIADELDLHISKVSGEKVNLDKEGGFVLSTHSVYETLQDMVEP